MQGKNLFKVDLGSSAVIGHWLSGICANSCFRLVVSEKEKAEVAPAEEPSKGADGASWNGCGEHVRALAVQYLSCFAHSERYSATFWFTEAALCPAMNLILGSLHIHAWPLCN
eukprot:8841-Amphidinium_carterae.3